MDDLFITSEHDASIQDLIKFLEKKYMTITVKTDNHISYLGMNFDFKNSGEVSITMPAYVEDILKLYSVSGLCTSPANNQLFHIREEADPLDKKQKDEFHSRVAKLLYLAKRVRPDVLTAVAFLSTRVNCPDEDDWAKLDRVLKYINGTRELGIVLRPDEELKLYAYIDASYGVHSDGKSHSGSVIMLGSGPVHVRSAKQRLVVKSSAEAELVAVSDECSRVIWCRDFLIHQGYTVTAAVVYQDNKSTIAIINKGKHTSSRSKHINIRYFFIKDRVDQDEIKVKYLSTSEMISDVLTKPLQGEVFRALRKELMNFPTSQEQDTGQQNAKLAGECQGKSLVSKNLDKSVRINLHST